MSDVAGRVTPWAVESAAAHGCALVDVVYEKEGQTFVLRVTVEKEAGRLELDDCAAVSRTLSSFLDVEDVVPGLYRLEVSSPGLDRPLKKTEDFERFTGQSVVIRSYQPLPVPGTGEKSRLFRGTLLGLKEGQVDVELSTGIVSIPLSSVSKANLDVVF